MKGKEIGGETMKKKKRSRLKLREQVLLQR